jgi:DNA-3-methyladenine glycosylase
MTRLSASFFQRDTFLVGREILGKILVRKFANGEEKRYRITDIELYIGEEDEACHAHKGLTKRTEIMYAEGGRLYVYLIYGMYWMLNIVSYIKGEPHAILIRGIENIDGPGKVGKELQIDRTFYGEKLTDSHRIWIEDASIVTEYSTHKRIGISYASQEWQDKPWRYVWNIKRGE